MFVCKWCACEAIHSLVYRTDDSEIWYIDNLIPKDVHLETRFLNFAFIEGLTGVCWLTKNKYFFCLHRAVISYKNKIIVTIG